ncbi:hypothetical protein GA0070624_3466 [Micromonospora rhizosphaerae]|uniref:Uncharacterized protein n=1 Tax=Micromonospora rhizosphaerae TaxID=568872 RepID=A0A1C6SD16_9ACTN|nr:hypothetical protein GA0070624_3466 [Micromonospora rhizosphaerae]
MWKTQPIGLRGWRERWADRKNERQQRAYDAALEAWHQPDTKLRRLRAAASEFRGSADAAAGLALEFFPDEAVYTVLPAAELIEAEGRHIAGLPQPERAVLPTPNGTLNPVLADGLHVIDAGMVVVTNRAVVFVGHDGLREWTYARLSGVAHDRRAPFTLMHTVDEQRLSGLLLPPAAADGFRFHVTLAFADAIGERAAVVAQLDQVIAAYQHARPSPPVMVTSDQAPLTAIVTTLSLAIVVGLAVALSPSAGSSAPGGPDQPPRAVTGPAIAGTGSGSTVATGSVAAPATAGAATGSGAAQAAQASAVPPQASAPSGKPTPPRLKSGHAPAPEMGVSLALVNPAGHVWRVLSMTGILPMLSTPDASD